MAVDAAGVDRALGAIGTTFRLARLYPPTHPAVIQALHHIDEALAPLAALGTVEWKVGATGLHWRGQHLLPRNSQIAELAALLFARGVRGLTLNPGMTPEHVLALFGVATGTVSHDDTTLGRITLTLGRRSSLRLERVRTPTPAPALGVPAVPAEQPAAPDAPSVAAAPPPSADAVVGRRSGAVFRPDVLPADVEAQRAIATLGVAATADEQRVSVEKLQALAPELLALREVTTVADAIAALDRLLGTTQDPGLLEAIDNAALALSNRSLVERMVHRLAEARVPPDERESLVAAAGALAAMSVPLVVEGFLAAPPDQRAPFRAVIRKAADRALEPLQGMLADQDPDVVAAAAELLGSTASPRAVTLLLSVLHHQSEFVREAALIGLAEAGGQEVSRPAMPALKDESIAVRMAAARAIAAGGDPASSTVLIRRLDQEPDEGVQAELLRAIGRLAGTGALEVLAHYAEPGGMMSRRSATVRAAAIDGLRHFARPEARGLLELYSKDKEPAVRKAAEAALR
jgi:HEAT repeat protein